MSHFKNTIGTSRLKRWMTKVKNVVALFIILTPPLVSCGPSARAFFWDEPQGPKFAVNLDGFWSNWWAEYNYFDYYGIFRSNGDMHTDGVSDYIISPREELPSNYFLRIHINNYSQDLSTFDGFVEYYVSETYPTVESFFKKAYKSNSLNVFPRPQWVENTVKRKAKARIVIVERYKNAPRVLNCWFDNVGLGIDLLMIKWG